jgi:lantibiotic modifying enzyme
MGPLAAVLDVLCATDCHRDNLIADCEHPRLIDLGTLCRHAPRMIASGGAERSSIRQRLSESVAHTLMVPFQYFWDAGSEAIEDLSAIGAMTDTTARGQRYAWQQINTGSMGLALDTVEFPIRANVPVLNGELLPPFDSIDAIRGGFDETLRWLISVRERLLDPGSSFSALLDIPVRFLLRKAEIYRAVMDQDSIRFGPASTGRSSSTCSLARSW